MRVCIDARAIGPKTCGVSRSCREILRALAEEQTDVDFLVYVDRPVPDLVVPRAAKIRVTHCARMNPLHDLRLGRLLREDQPAIYHVLHSWLPIRIPRSTQAVLTVNDLFTVTDPHFFDNRRPFHKIARFYFGRLLSRSLDRADRVVAISNYTRQELLRIFPGLRAPIDVVHLAVTPFTERENLPPPEAREPFVLYIGNFRSYKDVPTLLRAFARYRSAHPTEPTRLVLAGNASPEQLRSTVQALGLSDRVIFRTRPSDDELWGLLRGAKALVQPSLYEGFGIPPLEAMASGTPVIISDAEALVEVSGDAALVFPRGDHEALFACLDAVIHRDTLAAELARRGRVRASAFRWSATAQRLLQLYQDVGTASDGQSAERLRR